MPCEFINHLLRTELIENLLGRSLVAGNLYRFPVRRAFLNAEKIPECRRSLRKTSLGLGVRAVQLQALSNLVSHGARVETETGASTQRDSGTSGTNNPGSNECRVSYRCGRGRDSSVEGVVTQLGNTLGDRVGERRGIS